MFSFREVKSPKPFKLKLRIPAWTESGSISRGGEELLKLGKEQCGTYQEVLVQNPSEEEIILKLDMPVRYTTAHSYVEENINQAAVERGPILYCVETPDVSVEALGDLMLPVNAQFKEILFEIEGRSMVALETEMAVSKRAEDYKPDALYQTMKCEGVRKVSVRMIPYYAWDNRGKGEMIVWLPLYWGN